MIDNFERGLSAVLDESKEDPFVQGMDKIYKQLMTELEGLEVKAIEAVGTEFNPDFHNAVMQVESEEFESGVVAQELQKGYMYRDSLKRRISLSQNYLSQGESSQSRFWHPLQTSGPFLSRCASGNYDGNHWDYWPEADGL